MGRGGELPGDGRPPIKVPRRLLNNGSYFVGCMRLSIGVATLGHTDLNLIEDRQPCSAKDRLPGVDTQRRSRRRGDAQASAAAPPHMTLQVQARWLIALSHHISFAGGDAKASDEAMLNGRHESVVKDAARCTWRPAAGTKSHGPTASEMAGDTNGRANSDNIRVVLPAVNAAVYRHILPRRWKIGRFTCDKVGDGLSRSNGETY